MTKRLRELETMTHDYKRNVHDSGRGVETRLTGQADRAVLFDTPATAARSS